MPECPGAGAGCAHVISLYCMAKGINFRVGCCHLVSGETHKLPVNVHLRSTHKHDGNKNEVIVEYFGVCATYVTMFFDQGCFDNLNNLK